MDSEPKVLEPTAVDVEKSLEIASTPKDGASEHSTSDTLAEPQFSRAKLTIIMGSILLNVLLSAMDQSIVATALPVIAEEFNSGAAYTWVGSAYLLASAAAGPNWGKTSDIFGRKPMFFAATIFFLIGSLLCGVARNSAMLIAGRAVAGAGGGGINLLALICISDIVPIRKRSLYIGYVSTVWAFATGFGPVLGGVFTSRVTWRWCFFINLPIGGLALTALYFFLHIETPKITLVEGLRRIDWSGAALVVSGTVLFLYGLEVGGVTAPWNSPEVICLLVLGVVLWSLFLLNEHFIPKRPIMPLKLFRNRSNVGAFGVCALHGLLFISGPYYLPLYFQAVLGASPIISGVLLLPYNILLSVGAIGTSWLTNKTGRYWLIIVVSMVITALGHGLLIDLPEYPGWAKIIIYTMIAGFGIGPNFASPMIAMQSEVSKENTAVGIAALAFIRITCSSASIVIGGAIFQNAMQSQLPVISAVLGDDLAQRLSGGSAEANVGLIATLPESQRDLVRGVFLTSLSKIWYFYVAAAGTAVFVSFLIRNNRLNKSK